MTARILVLACLPAALAFALLVPAAQASPGCDASSLTAAIGAVGTATSGWLVDHPEAQDAINTANQNTITAYFTAHQDQWHELQALAAPLRSLRNSCPQQVSGADVARLFDAMAS